MTTPLLTGLHHVTAFAGSPPENLAFYTGVLGLRLVKKTVNFDDPLVYHLYYADHHGSPGTLLTHFPQPYAEAGVHGSPEIGQTLLRVARGTLGAWEERLRGHGVTTSRENVFGAERVLFEDPHTMRFGLVEGDTEQLRVEGAVIETAELDGVAAFLRETLGFIEDGADRGRRRLRLGEGTDGACVELAGSSGVRSVMGAGTVHHVAWRVPDEGVQSEVVGRLRAARVATTEVKDRQYFKSVYCRIPGGVIFEIATDGPGFAIDERLEHLGEGLMLPPMHEGRRGEIEAHLEPL